ncbi:MAG: cell division protein FtsZ [Clostridiales Family XIII bacterium]|jgi:cell division protein FtsZ|nr:cell division protein FtsZ [Clostridiales Family XIII bacterium]
MLQDGRLIFERNEETFAKIIVVGIGGGGGNAVNRMIDSELAGVEYAVVNTDKQDLAGSKADTKIQIGDKVTGGLGAGGNPEKGQASAEENIQEIENAIKGADMVFITAGMGGGTGTGAAPIVAKVSKDLGILTVGIVTKPFSFEGKKRRDNAELGISYLKKYVDSLVIVPNDKLLLISDKNTTIENALMMANEVLKQAVRGITDIISRAGLINRDFADVRTVMSNRGIAHIGIGRAKGENKVADAVQGAIESPLLETSIAGAKAVILYVSGGYDLGMLEVNEAADQIEQAVDRDAIVIFGTSVYEELADEMVVTVIATGFEERPGEQLEPMKQLKLGLEKEDASAEDAGARMSDEGETAKKKSPGLMFSDYDDDGDRFGFNAEKEPQQESLLTEDDIGGANDFTVPEFLKKD